MIDKCYKQLNCTRAGDLIVHYVRIGKKALNLDSIAYCEVQVWQDELTVKVYFMGAANNTPLVFGETEAKDLWKYLEYIAEKPV